MVIPRKVIATAPGRVCLAGENVDWMVGPVVTAALQDMSIRVEVTGREDNLIEVYYGSWYNIHEFFRLEASNEKLTKSSSYLRSVINTLRAYEIPLRGLRICVTSTLPPFGGLASSGSLCVALVGGISKYLGITLTPEKIAALAYLSENRLVNCGQMDQYASALGGVLFMDCSMIPPRIDTHKCSNELFVLVGSTGKNMPFKEVYKELSVRWAEKEVGIMQYVNRTVENIHKIRTALTAQEFSTAGKLINECQIFISEDLRIGNEVIEGYVDIAQKCGALGAKSCGTRKVGGSMFALINEPELQETKRKLELAGAQTFVSRIGKNGIQIIDSKDE